MSDDELIAQARLMCGHLYAHNRFKDMQTVEEMILRIEVARTPGPPDDGLVRTRSRLVEIQGEAEEIDTELRRVKVSAERLLGAAKLAMTALRKGATSPEQYEAWCVLKGVINDNEHESAAQPAQAEPAQPSRPSWTDML